MDTSIIEKAKAELAAAIATFDIKQDEVIQFIDDVNELRLKLIANLVLKSCEGIKPGLTYVDFDKIIVSNSRMADAYRKALEVPSIRPHNSMMISAIRTALHSFDYGGVTLTDEDKDKFFLIALEWQEHIESWVSQYKAVANEASTKDDRFTTNAYCDHLMTFVSQARKMNDELLAAEYSLAE